MNRPNEGDSIEDAKLSEEQIKEMESTRKVLMADPTFRRNYEELNGKSLGELEEMVKAMNEPGNEFARDERDAEVMAEFSALHFLIYERKVLDGTWPLDKNAY